MKHITPEIKLNIGGGLLAQVFYVGAAITGDPVTMILTLGLILWFYGAAIYLTHREECRYVLRECCA